MEEATKLVGEIIANLAKNTASFLVNKAKEYAIDIGYKDQIDTGEAFDIYLRKVYDTYSKSKSLVYSNEARDLSSFFQPCDLAIGLNGQALSFHYTAEEDKNKLNTVSTEDITKVLDNGSKLLIIGNGGMGKTILLKHFCVNSIEVANKVPVFISLRWLNNEPIFEESFETIIYKQLKVFSFKLSYEYFLYSLEGDRYLFIFDGFDEISREKQAWISHMLSDFTRKYRDNYFVISSREDEKIAALDEYKVLTMCPLSFEQAKGLINKLDIGHAFKERFFAELQNGLYKEYYSFISVPLLLSILFITYIEKSTVPKALNEFYEEAFETLLYRHDRKKEGFERILESGLSYEAFRNVFMLFCFRTYFKEQYSFTKQNLIQQLSDTTDLLNISVNVYQYQNDLTQIACMLIRDGREYVFVHRSFQEYFAAYYVSLEIDEKQRNLCHKLWERKYFSVYDADKRRDFYICPVRGQRSFFEMLQSIEPKKFDHILFWPLLEMIYNEYIKNGNNLVDTVSTFFGINSVNIDNTQNLNEYEWFIKEDDYKKLIWFKIFYYFYFFTINADDNGMDEHEESIKQIIREDKSSSKKLIVFKRAARSWYQNVIERFVDYSDNVYVRPVAFIIFAIKLYEAQYKANILYDNLLEEF